MQRLRQDIAEVQNVPYPNIAIHLDDNDITQACLILTPERSSALHLTVRFPVEYPLQAPNVTIQSSVVHPNVFGNYICASILNTEEGWTPAYTLKGIAIQLLSFFSSDQIEQEYGGHVDLNEYRSRRSERDYYPRRGEEGKFCCSNCGYGRPHSSTASVVSNAAGKAGIDLGTLNKKLFTMPDEILLMVLTELDTKDLFAASEAFPEVRRILASYDFIRVRELQCFCLKKGFMATKLGVGVSVSERASQGNFASEFDLLSKEAFDEHRVRRSIQGVMFDHWLPLPISRRHWRLVRPDLKVALDSLARKGRLETASNDSVIYHFMNNIVVDFSRDAEETMKYGSKSKSTLTHASEKAVEAYFALFHLLLCLATENHQMIRDANRMILRFLSGSTSKAHFPNLGILLVAVLISDQGLTEELTLAIVKEAILRNVVWMLDVKGAGLPELSYLEPSATSEYRLAKTFEASKTSYRLLMFLSLFCKTARVPGKTLEDLREAMFDSHGAPPYGTAERMAKQIREIRVISHFPDFLKRMGISRMPSKEEFTAFLKRTITDSVKAGYSCQPISQAQAFAMRKMVDPGVELADGVARNDRPPKYRLSFFPPKGGPQRGALQRSWR